MAEVGNDCPHEYGEADQGGGEQQLRQDHHGSGLEPASLDHLPVQEDHLLPKTQGRGKYTVTHNTKLTARRAGGRGGDIGSTGPKAGPNFGPSALCI